MKEVNDPINFLFTGVAKLPEVPFSAALDYHEKKDTLVNEVNRVMENNPELKKLIGKNPFSMMYDNHDNHAEFMSNVFRLNDFTFMLNTVLWVYRTYSIQGFSYDYWPAQLKAWLESIDRYLEPDKAIEIKTIYEWLIDNHQLLIKASEQDTDPSEILNSDWESLKTPFLNSLIEGNSSQSMKIAAERVHSSGELADFYLKVIQPTMYQVGLQWEKGHISVAQEHLASAIVTRVMSSLYPKFSVLDYTKDKAIVTAAPNEYHEIGPRMVADLLEINGWDVDYIGANVPARDIIDISLDRTPMFIAISVGMPFNLVRAQELVKSIKQQVRLNDTKVMLGGYSIVSNPNVKELINVDGYGDSASEAVNIAAEWWNDA